MALIYGKDGINHKVNKLYKGIGGVNKEQNKLYKGVSGVNKLVYQNSFKKDRLDYDTIYTVNKEITIIHFTLTLGCQNYYMSSDRYDANETIATFTFNNNILKLKKQYEYSEYKGRLEGLFLIINDTLIGNLTNMYSSGDENMKMCIAYNKSQNKVVVNRYRNGSILHSCNGTLNSNYLKSIKVTTNEYRPSGTKITNLLIK